MTNPVNNPMDTSPANNAGVNFSPLVEFRSLLEDALRRWPAATPPERASLDADICLASRSAYFDFHSELVVHSKVDEAAEQELDRLFQLALQVMQEPNQFRKSVESRYADFKTKCRRIRTRGIAHLTSETG